MFVPWTLFEQLPPPPPPPLCSIVLIDHSRWGLVVIALWPFGVSCQGAKHNLSVLILFMACHHTWFDRHCTTYTQQSCCAGFAPHKRNMKYLMYCLHALCWCIMPSTNYAVVWRKVSIIIDTQAATTCIGCFYTRSLQ